MGIFSKGKPARSEAPEFIEVGQIVNTHGVKGDVKVQPWDVTPAQLAGFKALYMDGTQFRPIDRRIQGDMVLMHFPGWDDMTRRRNAENQDPLHQAQRGAAQKGRISRCRAHRDAGL